jgi:hypothetical protein
LRHTAINVQVVGANPLSITPPSNITDILSAASYDWAELYAQIAIDLRDINKVSDNPERAATMMRRYAESAVRDFYKAINSALHAPAPAPKRLTAASASIWTVVPPAHWAASPRRTPGGKLAEVQRRHHVHRQAGFLDRGAGIRLRVSAAVRKHARYHLEVPVCCKPASAW